jgi:hypothetical protein
MSLKRRKELKNRNRWITDYSRQSGNANGNLKYIPVAPRQKDVPYTPPTKPSSRDDDGDFWNDYKSDVLRKLGDVDGQLKAPPKKGFNWSGAFQLAKNIAPKGQEALSRARSSVSNRIDSVARDQLQRSGNMMLRYDQQQGSNAPFALPVNPPITYIENLHEGKHDDVPEDTWSFQPPPSSASLSISQGIVAPNNSKNEVDDFDFDFYAKRVQRINQQQPQSDPEDEWDEMEQMEHESRMVDILYPNLPKPTEQDLHLD